MPKMYVGLPTYELLLKDGDYFKDMAEEFLKSCKGNPEKVHDVSIWLICENSKNKSETKKSINQIEQVIKKIRTLDSVTESDKKYLEKLFSLFMADHKLHLCVLEKEWKEAKKQCQYLLKESPKFIIWYGHKEVLNGCTVMEMIEKGESEESIRKTKEFKSILSKKDVLKDAYDKLFPKIVELLA